MYICIDIGGTKTLVASLTNDGIIHESLRFPTPESYDAFLETLGKTINSLDTRDFRAGAVAAPGTIDRHRDVVVACGNLTWKNVHLARDVERLTHCPIRLENDAKLGGLSEAMLLKNKYKKVLYVTISTGIGVGLIENGVIDTTLADGGGRTMLLEQHGKLTPWEDFASGRAIVRKYGKQASEITDPKIWAQIVRKLSPGFIELIAILDPDIIVVGGGVGHYFDQFGDLLLKDLKRYETPTLELPPFVGARRADEAVLYGCYDYARQKYA